MVYVFHAGIFTRKTPGLDCWKSSLISQCIQPRELGFIPENRAVAAAHTIARTQEVEKSAARGPGGKEFGDLLVD